MHHSSETKLKYEWNKRNHKSSGVQVSHCSSILNPKVLGMYFLVDEEMDVTSVVTSYQEFARLMH